MKKSNRLQRSSRQESYRLAVRTIQCPYIQEHAQKRGPARETEINLDKFREGKINLDKFRADKIYLGKFREDKINLDIFRYI